MMKGEIVQIGTPTEVYHNPRDIRVAQFIGSPEIKLIKGQRLSSGLIDVLGQKLDLSLNDLEPIDCQQDCEVHVGIRPENLFIVDEKPIPSSMQPALKIQCKVTLIENLCAEVFVHLYCSKNEH
jgi:multiple sugar transport system ATP-binding protein